LLLYLDKLRTDARERYEAEVAVWAALAPHSQKAKKPPAVPSILKDPDDNT
jgi:hypothetical protein